MKDTLILISCLLFVSISIVGIEELTDIKNQQNASNSKSYKLDNGMTYFGTNEEALRLKKHLKQ